MSERASKRLRKCDPEPNPSKRPPPKRRRKAPAKKSAKRKTDTAKLTAAPSTSTQQPVKFAVQVEVESCDEDWWYEEEPQSKETGDTVDWNVEESQLDKAASKCFQSGRNQNDEVGQAAKQSKFKFAYLEALNESSVLKKNEGTSIHSGRLLVTDNSESLKCQTDYTEWEDINYSGIKKEVIDESEDPSHADVCENLTEYLGITIKEEPLPVSIEENEEVTGADELCINEEAVQTVRHWDDDDKNKGEANEEHNHNDSQNGGNRVTSQNLRPLNQFKVDSSSVLPKDQNEGIKAISQNLMPLNQFNVDSSSVLPKDQNEGIKAISQNLMPLKPFNVDSSSVLPKGQNEGIKAISQNLMPLNQFNVDSSSVLPKDQNEGIKAISQNLMPLKPFNVDSSSVLPKGQNEGIKAISPNLMPVNQFNVDTSASYLSIEEEIIRDDPIEIPFWHISSRYFDMAISKAVGSLKHIADRGLAFDCGLCGQTFRSPQVKSRAIQDCVEDIRTHLNYSHLYDTLILKAVSSTGEGEPCTILAEKVDDTDERFMEVHTAAHNDLRLTRVCHRRIVSCLSGKKRRQFLSYKCYLCKLSYEYLGPFVDHLKATHTQSGDWLKLTITIEYARVAFLNVIAIELRPEHFEDFPVITDGSETPTLKCLKCKLDFGNQKESYVLHCNANLKCLGCKRNQACHNMHRHIGNCQAFFQKNYPKTCPCKQVFHSEKELDRHQMTCEFGNATLAFNCLVCIFVAGTIEMLVDHQRHAHTVRSDEFFLCDELLIARKHMQSAYSNENTCSRRPSKKPSCCPLCNRGTVFLEEHLKKYHRVRSVRVAFVKHVCDWCNQRVGPWGISYWRHMVQNHRINIQCVTNTINTSFCIICCAEFVNESSRDSHLRSCHDVRSDELINQEVTRCKFCQQVYPGPAVSHYCPDKLDFVCCLSCRRSFQNKLFLACHIKAQRPIKCTNCNERLSRSCMLPRHEVKCKGTSIIVHECLNCGFIEEQDGTSWFMDDHCTKCYTEYEKRVRVFFTRQMVVPKESVSDDPKNDHSYGNKNPAITDWTSELSTEIVTDVEEMLIESEATRVSDEQPTRIVTGNVLGAESEERDGATEFSSNEVEGKAKGGKEGKDSIYINSEAMKSSIEVARTVTGQAGHKRKRYILQLRLKKEKYEEDKKLAEHYKKLLHDQEKLMEAKKQRRLNKIIVPMISDIRGPKNDDSHVNKSPPIVSVEPLELSLNNVAQHSSNTRMCTEMEIDSAPTEVKSDWFVIGKERLQQMSLESQAKNVTSSRNYEAKTVATQEKDNITASRNENPITGVCEQVKEGTTKVDEKRHIAYVCHNYNERVNIVDACHKIEEEMSQVDEKDNTSGVCHDKEEMLEVNGRDRTTNACHDNGKKMFKVDEKDNTPNICQDKEERMCKDDDDIEKTMNFCHDDIKDNTPNVCQDKEERVCKDNVCHGNKKRMFKVENKDVTPNVCQDKEERVCKEVDIDTSNDVCHDNDKKVSKVDEKDNTPNVCRDKEERVCIDDDIDKTSNFCHVNEKRVFEVKNKDNTPNVCRDKEERVCEDNDIDISSNVCNVKDKRVFKVNNKHNTPNACQDKEEMVCKDDDIDKTTNLLPINEERLSRVDENNYTINIYHNKEEGMFNVDYNYRTPNVCHNIQQVLSNVDEKYKTNKEQVMTKNYGKGNHTNIHKEEVCSVGETKNVTNFCQEEGRSDLEEGNVMEVLKVCNIKVPESISAGLTNKKTKNELNYGSAAMASGDFAILAHIKTEPTESAITIKTEPQDEFEMNSSELPVMKIKSEPRDFVDDFVVTDSAQVDAELSVEYFIENNAEIIDSEVAEVTLEKKKTGKRAYTKRKRIKKMYSCSYCPYSGCHKEYRAHKATCKNTKKLSYKIPLPYNSLDHCRSFKCFTCHTEYAVLNEYFTHNCRRKGSCPCCKIPYKTLSYLKVHLQAVIRKIYTSTPGDTTAKLFNCIECGQRVSTADVFNHWAEHRTLKHGKRKQIKSEVKIEPNADSDSSDYLLSEAKIEKELLDAAKKASLEEDVAESEQKGDEPDGAKESSEDVPPTVLKPEELRDLLEVLQMPLRNRRWHGCCIVCGKPCNRNREFKIHLIQHLLMHTLYKKKARGALRCLLCPSELATASDYKMHMRNHAGLALYQCPRCSKCFSDSSNLAKHKKVHNMEVKVCDICHRKFSSKIMLERHFEMHAKHEPQQCPVCQATFFYGSELRKHLKVRHRTEPQNYRCSFCFIKLRCMKHKWEHEWLAHGVRKQSADCPVCGQQFRKSSDVKRHFREVHESIFTNKSMADQRLRKLLAELAVYGVKPERVDKMVAAEISSTATRLRQILESATVGAEGEGQTFRSESEGVTQPGTSASQFVSQMVSSGSECVSQSVNCGRESVSQTVTSGSEFVNQTVNRGREFVSQTVTSGSKFVSQMVGSGSENVSQSVNRGREFVSQTVTSGSKFVSQMVGSGSENVSQGVNSGNDQLSLSVRYKMTKRTKPTGQTTKRKNRSVKQDMKKKTKVRQPVKSNIHSMIRLVKTDKESFTETVCQDASPKVMNRSVPKKPVRSGQNKAKSRTKIAGSMDRSEIVSLIPLANKKGTEYATHTVKRHTDANPKLKHHCKNISDMERSDGEPIVWLAKKGTEIATKPGTKYVSKTVANELIIIGKGAGHSDKRNAEFVTQMLTRIAGQSVKNWQVKDGTQSAGRTDNSNTKRVRNIVREGTKIDDQAVNIETDVNLAAKSENDCVSQAVRSESDWLNQAVKSKTECVSQAVKSETECVSQAVKSETECVSHAVRSESDWLNQAVKSKTECVSQAVKSKTECVSQAVRSVADKFASDNEIGADGEKRMQVRWTYLRKSAKCSKGKLDPQAQKNE